MKSSCVWRVVILSFLVALMSVFVIPVAAAEGGDPTGIGPITAPELSSEWVAGFLYILLMVLLEYIPPFTSWWATFNYKREVVAGVGLLVIIALVGLHYLGAFDLQIGVFGWAVVGDALDTWLSFLGGAWLIWSALEGVNALPRKVVDAE